MFFRTAWKKAGLSWKANRSIGDTIEHQFDGKQTRNMENESGGCDGSSGPPYMPQGGYVWSRPL